jgi:hypothetical protein
MIEIAKAATQYWHLKGTISVHGPDANVYFDCPPMPIHRIGFALRRTAAHELGPVVRNHVGDWPVFVDAYGEDHRRMRWTFSAAYANRLVAAAKLIRECQ